MMYHAFILNRYLIFLFQIALQISAVAKILAMNVDVF